MSTEAALLRTIRDTPDDDTARLVYADFVEEEGDAARGEFIRVQIALACTQEGDPLRSVLEDREHELLAENEHRWIGADCNSDGLVTWRFERGFISELSATPSFMLNEGADVCAAHPVRMWRVQCTQQDMHGDLCEAGKRTWFSRLEAINLAGWFEALGEMERFLTRSDFERLRDLDLTNRPGLDDLPGMLERAPFRDQLKVLRVGGSYPGQVGRLDAWDLSRALAPTRLNDLSMPACLLTAADVRGILIADCCRELVSLDIRDNHLEPDGWDAFRGPKCKLRELDLSGTPLGAIALEDVLRQEPLAELRTLHLNRCGSAMANIRALAGSRFWTQAEELRMQNGLVPENSLEPIFSSAGPQALRVLDVAQNFFRDTGVAGLCATRWADSLTWLSLAQNYLTDEALRTIAQSGKFTHLRTLHLSHNNQYQEGAEHGERLTDAGIRALAESPHLANVRVLGISGTDVTAAGIEALLASPHLRLIGLALAGCNLDAAMLQLLANAPALTRVRWLDLGGYYYRMGEKELMPLAESEYLSPLCELDIRGSHVDADTQIALRGRLGRRLLVGERGGELPVFDV
jgi:uncharacterized protein (TIGR02996 family)